MKREFDTDALAPRNMLVEAILNVNEEVCLPTREASNSRNNTHASRTC